ncbi:alpha/beta-hydrolase [Cucurbitaria berberidis CBS 394.84]|uniref:Carboxylic ester hydrolase n=1 Tax=Cucurbitaria berberidis CBS 394.84 TaxID=1168544 RepID=A0A9P4LAJ0_9PLEO|nr:alpha/beta-hydrolase [Cucurbitaria berberidis CBS 394.84]KAF1847553.1 alpha/beta-hydrolase [Cucurbitaria berberidis CBS 394.84]
MRVSVLPLFTSAIIARAGAPQASDTSCNVTYQGIERNGIEVFLGIPYAQDTSGENRFKPPRPQVPPPGSTVDATKPGFACPQPLGQATLPLALGNITHVSEDCLNLNVARPKQMNLYQKLPVMVWIHGGGFWSGANTEPTTAPDGLIHQSVENGLPIIHVAINYRLAFFGFAQSDSLKAEGSENAGLRDQRLAIEWVRDNIEHFGGDPGKITIFGQSSGGLAIGLQILAYGGTKALPFQQGIAESQALEPGITGNFTKDAMTALVNYVGCNATLVESPATIDCLRQLDTGTLLNATIATFASDIAHNVGDIWLPVVDGDFLPAPPSQLIAEGRFGNATFMSGWTQDDLNYYTDASIASADDTYKFMRAYLPGMPEDSLETLLDMYPVEEFAPGKDLSSEFYRAARIFRDILMVCPSIHLGVAVHQIHSAPVFFYNFNSTILDPILAATSNISGLGVVHTSEFAYILDNLEKYNVSGYPFNPTEADYELAVRASRSWSNFANEASPSSTRFDDSCSTTLQGWEEAFERPGGPYFMTIGGPNAGLSALGGANATRVIQKQKLDDRCAFLNSPDIINALQY